MGTYLNSVKYQLHPLVFPLSGGTVRVNYVAAGTPTNRVPEVYATSGLQLDLTPEFNESIVPGSLVFQMGGKRYFDKIGALYNGLDIATGAATLAGAINYQTGQVSVSDWTPGQANAVSLLSLLTTTGDHVISNAAFRVPVAPVRTGSLQILATKQLGGTINVTADLNGVISAAGVRGGIDYATGVVAMEFGNLVTAAGNEAAYWYRAVDVVAGQVWKPEYVFADTIKYNAVAYTYLPLDANLLGLDPVRLPQDGRVPIFRTGGFAVLGNTQSVTATVSNGQVIDCARVRLSRVRVIGSDGVVINVGYSAGLDAGLVTFSDVSSYPQPVKIEHRIEDMMQVSDVQISGQLGFTRRVTHDYPVSGSYISSALISGDLKARVSFLFDQATWNGTSWLDVTSGAVATGTYNDVISPIVVTNKGAVPERWALQFTNSSTFNIIGEHVGVIGTGNINTECAPINPATGVPYFTVPVVGWGTGWTVGNVLRLNTVGAMFPVWCVRTIQQGPNTGTEHSFTLLSRGDVDA
jgi:hypothetical protein